MTEALAIPLIASKFKNILMASSKNWSSYYTLGGEMTELLET